MASMRFRLSLTQKGLLLISIPLVFEIVFVGYLWGLIESAEKQISRQERAHAILSHMNALTRDIVDAGQTAGSYSCPVFLASYADSLSKTSREFKALESLTSEDPNESRIVKKVEQLTEKGMFLVTRGRQLLKQGEVDEANKLLVDNLKPLIEQISKESDLLTNEARHDQEEGPEARLKAQAQVRSGLLIGLGFNILLAISLAGFVMKNISRNVSVLMDNTIRLAKRQPFNPPLDSGDEIEHLDQVLRDMACAIELASRRERAIFQNARDMICTITDGGVFSNVSPASVELLGYEPAEMEGMPFVDLCSETDKRKAVDLLRNHSQGTSIEPFETRLLRKDGVTIHVLWSVQWSSQENCLYCIAHEITGRKVAEELLKASEARTRSILNSTPAGIVALDDSGVIQMSNAAVATMFGTTCADLRLRSVVELFKLPQGKTAGQFLRDSLDKTVRVDAYARTGRIFPAEVTLKQFEGATGCQYLFVVMDVTERQQVEQMKQSFVAMVSHELRTPLTSVQGFLDLLSAGGYGAVPDAVKTKSNVASRNVSRLIDLINDILDAEKLESGKFEFRFSEIRMQEVMKKAVDAVRDFADKSGVTIEIDPFDVETVADQERLVQVVINFLSNAVKFSPKQSTVKLAVTRIGNVLEVSVTDSGPGIPVEYQQSIFERFQQVRGNKTRHAGSGLGLAISKSIIEQHNGQIGVDSAEGQGSRFWFRVPVVVLKATAV